MVPNLYFFLSERLVVPKLPDGFGAAKWTGRWMSRRRRLGGRAFAKLPGAHGLPECLFEAEVLALTTCLFGRVGIGASLPLRVGVVNRQGDLSHDESAAAVPVGGRPAEYRPNDEIHDDGFVVFHARVMPGGDLIVGDYAVPMLDDLGTFELRRQSGGPGGAGSCG